MSPSPEATAGARRLVPGSDEVHVWRLRLRTTAAELGRLRGLLDDGERERGDKFVFAVHRDRYVAAHGLLRSLIAGYEGCPAAELAFSGVAGTKPHLAGATALRFSLSHSGDLGLVALAWNREVGIDVEVIRPLEDMAGLAATCFSPAERDDLASVPEPLRLAAFFAGWTRKEAFLKVAGDGLSRPLAAFSVTLRPGEPARLLHVAWDPASRSRYSLCDLRPGDGFAGALAAEGDVQVRLCGDVAPPISEDAGDAGRGPRRPDDVPGGGERRRPVLDLAGSEGAPRWLAAGGKAREQGGMPGVDRGRLEGHDALEPAAEVRPAS